MRLVTSLIRAHSVGAPTLTELANAPDATAFLFSGANVPAGGVDPISGAYDASGAGLTSDFACASAYFDSGAAWCDYLDGQGQTDQSYLGVWAGNPGSYDWSEQLYVRGAAVPEPITLSLFCAGLVGAAAMRRRKQVAA